MIELTHLIPKLGGIIVKRICDVITSNITCKYHIITIAIIIMSTIRNDDELFCDSLISSIFKLKNLWCTSLIIKFMEVILDDKTHDSYKFYYWSMGDLNISFIIEYSLVSYMIFNNT